jgi:lysozyme
MKTSAAGRGLIEAFEGLFLDSYQDSVGVWTIGYGHTTAAGGPPVHQGMMISRKEADDLLSNDLARVEYHVGKCITVPLEQWEFDALVSFDFNTGALRSGTVDDKINAGNKITAMDTLLLYNHAGGKVLAGLTRRRHAEKLMFEGKVAESLKLATEG